MDTHLILFDGVCNFCNHWVQFVLQRNSSGTLRFGTLQGKTAHLLLPQYGLRPDALSSVVFISNGKAFTSSTAVLQICKHLDGGWKLLWVFIWVPRFLRDALYNMIARHRYQWFGKKESCMLPTAEQRSRFVD